MQLPDGRAVPDLHLDPATVERCRALADHAAARVLEFVGRHTTVSIERTVLRLFGFHEAGPGGVPLVNLVVDQLQERQLTGRGSRRRGRARRSRSGCCSGRGSTADPSAGGAPPRTPRSPARSRTSSRGRIRRGRWRPCCADIAPSRAPRREHARPGERA